MPHYKNKGMHGPVLAGDIRWKGEYSDYIEKPPKAKKGPRHRRKKK